MTKITPAFTLIEVLVASTIIIVLMSIGVASYSTATQNARNAKRKSDMESVRQAMVLKKAETGSYGVASSFEGVWGLASAYMSGPKPSDPVAGRVYTGNSTPTTFCICAQLDGTNKGNATNTSCNYATGNYYCVSNP